MREDQARGQKRKEQERGEPGRPEREPEARGDPTWGQDEEAVRAPHGSDFFFRSRQGKEEHLGPGWSQGGSYSGLSLASSKAGGR